MRILALRPEGLVIPHIHSSMVRAFRTLGIEVTDLPFPQREESLQDLISLASPEPAAVFTLDLPLHSILNQFLKDVQETIKVPWIVWFVDDPAGYGFPDCCDPARTLVFCWDRQIVSQLSLMGSWKGIPPIYLPLAVDPGVFYPQENGFSWFFPGGVFVGSTAHPNPILDRAIQNSPGFWDDISKVWEVWKKDLGFFPQELAWDYLEKKTGQKKKTLCQDPLSRLWVHAAVYALGTRKRRELVSCIIGEGGAVFGDRGWEELAGDLYRGKAAYGDDLRRLYNRAGFVLDIPQPQARTGLTQRIFDACACGRPLLTQFSPEIESLLDSENAVLAFHTLEEAQEGKEKIMKNGWEVKNSVSKARDKILALHTYRHRAVQILKTFQRFFPVPGIT
jgi:spore maturation protein CgeB